MQAAGAVANLVELRKVSSWQQSSFIEKGGWATLRTAPHWSPFDNGTGTSCLSGNRHKRWNLSTQMGASAAMTAVLASI